MRSADLLVFSACSLDLGFYQNHYEILAYFSLLYLWLMHFCSYHAIVAHPFTYGFPEAVTVGQIT